MTQKKRQNLTKKADALFGKIIRHPGVCASCGSTEFIQCAHGFSRRYRAVRWHPDNAFPLCRKCHVYFTHRPLEWDEWLRERWGEALYDELRDLALHGRNPDLREVLAVLKARWADIEREAA